jgi:hypothetical protein
MPLPRPYKLLMLPDETRITPQLEQTLRTHFDNGGKVISSMFSGMAEGGTTSLVQAEQVEEYRENSNASATPELASSEEVNFSIDKKSDYFVFAEWGIDFEGISPWNPAFITPVEPITDFPEMPITCIRRGSIVSLHKGTRSGAQYVAPYFNRVSRDQYYFQYLPPDKPTGKSVMTINNQVIHVSFPIFAAYYESGRLEYRTLIKWALKQLLPKPLICSCNAPSFVKVFVTSQPGRRMIHIISNFPERRTPKLEVIEDNIPINNMSLNFRLDGFQVNSAYSAPRKETVYYERHGNYLQVKVPDFKGHTLIVLEE